MWCFVTFKTSLAFNFHSKAQSRSLWKRLAASARPPVAEGVRHSGEMSAAAAPHANPRLHWRQTKALPVFLRDYQADEFLRGI